MRRLFLVLFGCSLLVSGAAAGATATINLVAASSVQVDEGVFIPPVTAPILDPFRPPTNPFGSGNRGVEYDTSVGQTVVATHGGVVTFSGQVGGSLFVTVQHSQSLKTTVGFVNETLVEVGDLVIQGQAIARAGGSIHFTARRHGLYIDPKSLFERFRSVVRLVAGFD
ncbi:MAG: murein DD-endopeptidase MepM/ murein hydrolase activator NlpD [Verrucomicrobiales bacterium]